ncbi:MAG TPA: hypothetical protein VGC41_25265, partial [Kofleriaceae bacterium]
MKWLLVVLVGCACPKEPVAPTAGSGSGSGSDLGSAAVGIATIDATSCDQVRPRIEALYRAEAQQKEP